MVRTERRVLAIGPVNLEVEAARAAKAQTEELRLARIATIPLNR